DGIRDGHVTGVQTCALPICVNVFGSNIKRRCLRRTQNRHLAWSYRVHVTTPHHEKDPPSRLSSFRCTARDSNALKWSPEISDAEIGRACVGKERGFWWLPVR